MITSVRNLALAVAALVAAPFTCSNASPVYSVLYQFTNGKDGNSPNGGLIADGKGNLYGTTALGGNHTGGVAFKLTPLGKIKILYSSGDFPSAPLAFDSGKNLWGTTKAGGGGANAGTVFEIPPSGPEKLVYRFGNHTGDPSDPLGGPTIAHGNVYATASMGGSGSDGAVVKITPQGKGSILHAFSDNPDGSGPAFSLTLGSDGRLYGETLQGGSASEGTIYAISTSGSEQVLYNFNFSQGGPYAPVGGVVSDVDGNIYGATGEGGSAQGGTVFKLTPKGVFSVLYAFNGGNPSSPSSPISGVVMDNQGNLYGLTQLGGSQFGGALYEISPNGTETTLYSFPEGSGPHGNLLIDKSGALYGATAFGGLGNGEIFKLVP